MAGLSQPCAGGLEWVPVNPARRLKELLVGFFKKKEIIKTARIYHGEFSYELVPNTAIKDFNNMNRVTSIDSGDFYVCAFEGPQYRGHYRIVGPGERAELDECGSLIVSEERVPVAAVRGSGRAPEGFWELSGPMYLFHFSSGYRCF
ncbi:MAG: hypothetical protein K6T29_00350 [Peptococcaceae bacterium]|nr:hypothetical protein [Peptococcaceae bacterium]